MKRIIFISTLTVKCRVVWIPVLSEFPLDLGFRMTYLLLEYILNPKSEILISILTAEEGVVWISSIIRILFGLRI